MKQAKKSSLSLWTLWAPLRFAIWMSVTTIIAIFGYSFISSLILTAPVQTSQTAIFALTSFTFLLSIFLTARKLPVIKMDQQLFIAIHILQNILLTIIISATTYVLLTNYQELILKLIVLDTKFSGTIIAVSFIATLFFFFFIGIFISGLYVKIRRIQDFNIPTWKILLSIPFGFSALWIPGFFLNTKQKKQSTQSIKSGLYSKFINWTLANRLNTIATFAFITLLSGLVNGINTTLLTFALALFFGIWIMHQGDKRFEKEMHKKYSTSIVIINLAMIVIILSLYVLAPKPANNIQINISDTAVTSTITGNLQ